LTKQAFMGNQTLTAMDENRLKLTHNLTHT
jgi:hypothetical protein